MILLWGLSGDGPLDEVSRTLLQNGSRFTLLDQRDILGTGIDLEIGRTVTGTVTTQNDRIDLSEVTAVYQRAYDWRRLPEFAEAGPESASWASALAIESALHAWVEITSALVINRPSDMASNNSKPYQTGLIRQQGFRVPATLITTDPDAVREFCREHDSIIYKSISSVRSIVSRVTLDQLDRLDDVAWCPTQFQQYVPGSDYRVHVVGDQLFACEIVSDAVDYRYSGRFGSTLELKACDLPADVGERARAVAASLKLPVAGVDLRLTPDGEWFCFEVNPSPGFTFYEALTNQPIAEAIASLLAGHTN